MIQHYCKAEQAKSNYPNIIRGTLFQLGKIIVVLIGFKAIGIATWNLISAAIVLPIAYKLFRKLPYGKFNSITASKFLKFPFRFF